MSNYQTIYNVVELFEIISVPPSLRFGTSGVCLKNLRCAWMAQLNVSFWFDDLKAKMGKLK